MFLINKRNGIFFKVTLLVFIVCLRVYAFATILPVNKTALNYTQVMFEYDQLWGADSYVITITPSAKGGNVESGKPIIIKNNSLAVLVKTGLVFGQSYEWYYEAYRGNKKLKKSDVYSFSIVYSRYIDTNYYKSKVTFSDMESMQDNVLFLDYIGVAINRKGEPIWYLPTKETASTALNYRNMKLTATGTITFLKDSSCSETDINGGLLWHAPDDGQVSKDRTEWYHHDFAKMADGTYMACGNLYRNDHNMFDPELECRVKYNTLIQYDSLGKAIWWWSDEGKFNPKTVFASTFPTSTQAGGGHMNSFFYDAANDAFLVSFRNTSRLVKVDKKSGEVIYQFGPKNDTFNLPNLSDAVFSSQHAAVLDAEGDILFYNNNTEGRKSRGVITYPHIMILKQPSQSNATATTVWDYECKTDSFPEGISAREGFAMDLPNKNILVCMGGANRTFEITRDKKIVWECFHSYLDQSTGAWLPFTNYRNNFASSLFPRYFTVEKLAETQQLKAGSNFKDLKINNEGTDNDEYTIEVLSSMKNPSLSKTTLSIKAHASSKINIKVPKQAAEEKQITLSIYPSNHPSSARAFTFNVVK